MMVLYIVISTIASGGGRYGTQTGFAILLVYAGAYVMVRYSLSALYLIGRPNVSLRRKLWLFFFGTAAAVVLNLLLLTPTRYVALTKLFDNRWQTRELSAHDLAQLSQNTETA